MFPFKNITYLLTKAILIGVFVTSGVSKLTNPNPFKKILRRHGINKQTHLSVLNWTLSVVEILIGLLLIFPFTELFGLVISVSLLCIFTVFVSYSLLTGNVESCGCFGNLSKDTINWKTVLRNLLLLFSAMGLLYINFRENNLQIIILSAVFAIIGVFLLIMPSIGDLSITSSSQSKHESLINLNRRGFLKLLGGFIGAVVPISLLSTTVSAEQETACCKCQIYKHFETGCGCWAEYSLRHYFKRCCNTCNGQLGVWRKYQPDACTEECPCGTGSCDVLYPCTGSMCYPADCSGCPY